MQPSLIPTSSEALHFSHEMSSSSPRKATHGPVWGHALAEALAPILWMEL